MIVEGGSITLQHFIDSGGALVNTNGDLIEFGLYIKVLDRDRLLALTGGELQAKGKHILKNSLWTWKMC